MQKVISHNTRIKPLIVISHPFLYRSILDTYIYMWMCVYYVHNAFLLQFFFFLFCCLFIPLSTSIWLVCCFHKYIFTVCGSIKSYLIYMCTCIFKWMKSGTSPHVLVGIQIKALNKNSRARTHTHTHTHTDTQLPRVTNRSIIDNNRL